MPLLRLELDSREETPKVTAHQIVLQVEAMDVAEQSKVREGILMEGSEWDSEVTWSQFCIRDSPDRTINDYLTIGAQGSYIQTQSSNYETDSVSLCNLQTKT